MNYNDILHHFSCCCIAALLRQAIDEGYDTSVCLLNYRADGTTFWNQFFVASLRDGKGDTVNYVGVQCKVNDSTPHLLAACDVSPSNRSG